MEEINKSLRTAMIKRRVYPIVEKIDWKIIDDMRREMHLMVIDDPDKDIYLLLDSEGGESGAALAGYDFFKAIPAKVTAVINGFCKSSCLELIAGCTKRLATKNSVFFFHSAKVHMEITTSIVDEIDNFIAERMKQYQLYVDAYYDAYLQGFGLEKNRVRELERIGDAVHRSYTAHEAKELGVIHEIIDQFPFYEFKSPHS